MKKILIAFIMLFPIICYANTNIGTLSSPSEIYVGDNFDVTFSVNTTDSISSIDGILKYDYTKIELLEDESLGKLDCILNNSLSCSSANSITGAKEVVAFHFKAKSNLKIGSTITISLNNISYNGEHNNENLSTKIKVLANKNRNADLKSLKVNNVEVLNSLNYTIDLSEIVITAEASIANTSIIGLGKKNLKVGNNVFNIVTTSESGLKRAYILNIKREEKQENNNSNENTNNSNISNQNIENNSNSNNINTNKNNKTSATEESKSLDEIKEVENENNNNIRTDGKIKSNLRDNPKTGIKNNNFKYILILIIIIISIIIIVNYKKYVKK